MCGTPFISASSGSVTRRSTSSAAWPGHCETISTLGDERSGYASTGIRLSDSTPAMITITVAINTRNRCLSAN